MRNCWVQVLGTVLVFYKCIHLMVKDNYWCIYALVYEAFCAHVMLQYNFSVADYLYLRYSHLGQETIVFTNIYLVPTLLIIEKLVMHHKVYLYITLLMMY